MVGGVWVVRTKGDCLRGVPTHTLNQGPVYAEPWIRLTRLSTDDTGDRRYGPTGGVDGGRTRHRTLRKDLVRLFYKSFRSYIFLTHRPLLK